MGLSTHYEENLVALIKQLRVQCECTLLKLIVHTTAVSVLRIPSGLPTPASYLPCPPRLFRPHGALSWSRCCRQRPQRQVRDRLVGADRQTCLSIVVSTP